MIDSAATALYDAMKTLTPCRQNPSQWDADEDTPLSAIRDLVRQCRTGCPVLETCASFAATQPKAAGVLAGRYLPHSDDQPLASAFAADLQHRILEGEFLPGDTLPAELTFSTTVGCTPQTATAAYSALKRSQFIKTKTFRGTTIHIVLAKYT